MKLRKLFAMLLAIVMVFSLAACGSSDSDSSDDASDDASADTTEETADNSDILIGISMPTNSLERWNRDGSYLKEQFEAAGYSVELTYSDNDTDQQNNDIQTMIADGVDILIIAAIDGETLSVTLEDAVDADIPVIAYDRLIMNTDAVSYYVSFDNYVVGQLQGEYIEEALDLANATETYTMEITAGPTSDNNSGYFYNGAMDVLQPYIDSGVIEVLSGQTTFEQCATEEWSTDNALDRMQNILGSYYTDVELDIALCSNDSTALGVAQAISSDYNGSNTVLITGQDGDVANLQNIVDGLQTMTVYKNVSDESIVTLALAQEILAGNEPGEELIDTFDIDCAYDTESYDNNNGIVPSYLLVPYVITVDNLDLLVETGLYEWDGDYLVSATDE